VETAPLIQTKRVTGRALGLLPVNHWDWAQAFLIATRIVLNLTQVAVARQTPVIRAVTTTVTAATIMATAVTTMVTAAQVTQAILHPHYHREAPVTAVRIV